MMPKSIQIVGVVNGAPLRNSVVKASVMYLLGIILPITSVTDPSGMNVPKNICGIMNAKLIPVATSADFEIAAEINPKPTDTRENMSEIAKVNAMPAMPVAGRYPIAYDAARTRVT